MCPHCGFELAHADRAFGAVPPLQPDITDLAGVLKERELKELRTAIHKAQHPFPQLKLSAVVVRLPENLPLRAITFWLFNRGQISTPMESGAACRLVLFVIDVHAGRATCMVGYGLEPFLPEATLTRIVQAAQSPLLGKNYAGAFKAMLAKSVTELEAVGMTLPQKGVMPARPANEAADADAFVY